MASDWVDCESEPLSADWSEPLPASSDTDEPASIHELVEGEGGGALPHAARPVKAVKRTNAATFL